MAAAHPTELNTLIMVKSGAGIDVAAHAAGMGCGDLAENGRRPPAESRRFQRSRPIALRFLARRGKPFHEFLERTAKGVEEE